MRIDSWTVLEEINKDPKLIETKYRDNAMLKIVLQEQFVEPQWILPEGIPPFKESQEADGMHMTNLYTEARKLYVFRRSDLKPVRRESIFIDLLQNLDPREVVIVLALKDKNLNKLYPKITKKVAGKIIQIPEAVRSKKKDDTQSV